jgi:hypothetical protein
MQGARLLTAFATCSTSIVGSILPSPLAWITPFFMRAVISVLGPRQRPQNQLFRWLARARHDGWVGTKGDESAWLPGTATLARASQNRPSSSKCRIATSIVPGGVDRLTRGSFRRRLIRSAHQYAFSTRETGH